MAAKDDLEQASGYSYLAGKLHVLVVVPLYAPAPNVAGWFGVAYPIDHKFAEAIKSTTRLEVTFTSDDPDEPQPRVLTSTLDAPMAAAALARNAMTPGSSRSTCRAEIRHPQWRALRHPLSNTWSCSAKPRSGLPCSVP